MIGLYSLTLSSFLDSQRRWVLGFAFLVMGLTLLPYFLGFANEGANWRFTGFVIGVEDGNSYIAKMMTGATGAWLFRTPYTAHRQSGVIAFLPYLVLGKLTSPPSQHLQLVIIYHLFRLMAGILAILASYDFLSIFVNDLRLRRFGLVLAVLGGGLGWVLVLLGRPYWLGSLPLEFYSPESFGFLALFGLPHLSMARALLLWALVNYLSGNDVDETILGLSMIRPGVLFFLLGFFQPLTIIVGWVVIAAHIGLLTIQKILEDRAFTPQLWGSWMVFVRKGVGSIFISSPIVVYTVVKFKADPFLRGWTDQNLILSPHPWHYFIAYGLLMPFAIFGAYHLIKKKPLLSGLPIGWVLLLPFLAYAPFNLQRRLPEAVWVAIIALGIAGIEAWRNLPNSNISTDKLSAREPRYLQKFTLPLLLVLPSTLFLFAGSLQAVNQPGKPVYRPVNEVAAFKHLAKNANQGEIVLTAYNTGNVLPAWAPVHVVIGHGPESLNLEELRPRVKAFYTTSTPDIERIRLLEAVNVKYVFWGPSEQALGDWNPASADYLELIYNQDKYKIFKVSGGG